MFEFIVATSILVISILHPIEKYFTAQSLSSESDFCIQEKKKISSLPHVRLVIWFEDLEDFNVELSETDAQIVRELLLAHTRYKASLKQEREDFWKGIDDGYEPPLAMLVFESGNKSQSLDLSIGYELISQSQNKRMEEDGYCFTGVEIIMDDDAYRQLLQLLRPYLPAKVQETSFESILTEF